MTILKATEEGEWDASVVSSPPPYELATTSSGGSSDSTPSLSSAHQDGEGSRRRHPRHRRRPGNQTDSKSSQQPREEGEVQEHEEEEGREDGRNGESARLEYGWSEGLEPPHDVQRALAPLTLTKSNARLHGAYLVQLTPVTSTPSSSPSSSTCRSPFSPLPCSSSNNNPSSSSLGCGSGSGSSKCGGGGAWSGFVNIWSQLSFQQVPDVMLSTSNARLTAGVWFTGGQALTRPVKVEAQTSNACLKLVIPALPSDSVPLMVRASTSNAKAWVYIPRAFTGTIHLKTSNADMLLTPALHQRQPVMVPLPKGEKGVMYQLDLPAVGLVDPSDRVGTKGTSSQQVEEDMSIRKRGGGAGGGSGGGGMASVKKGRQEQGSRRKLVMGHIQLTSSNGTVTVGLADEDGALKSVLDGNGDDRCLVM